jgi:hypothetical protein
MELQFLFVISVWKKRPAKAQETVFADYVPDSISQNSENVEKNKVALMILPVRSVPFRIRNCLWHKWVIQRKMDLGISGQDYLLQSDFSWKSAY